MKKVLIVDDEPGNLKLIVYIVERLGYEVVATEDGEAVFSLIEEHHPDLILMDLRLRGELDGTDLAVIIRQEMESDLPIIAVTAADILYDEDTVMRSGFNAYFKKPIDPRALGSLLTQYLE